MRDRLAELTETLLAEARRAGADAADALATDGRALSIEVRNGALEHAERSEGVEIGLRVLLGQRQACVSASDIRPETLTEMAARAVAMAREAPEDAGIGLAEPGDLSPARNADGLELCDPAPEPDPQALEQDALAAEAAALAVPGVTRLDGASAGYWQRRTHLAASNGFSGGYRRSGRSVSCVAISGAGLEMERDHAFESRVFQADLPPPESVGSLAGERAVARRRPTRPPTGAFPVLFDERVAGSLIGHLLAAINGNAILRGASWLREAMGERVLPPGLDLCEDPLRRRISGSRPFDGEGLAARPRAFVRDGVLESWVLDLASARRLGLESTGNGMRGPSAPPSPGIGNIDLTQGSDDRDALVAAMGTGLIVTAMIGSSINPTTGDYSRGASGFWVENGEITGPVNQCTIAGNLRRMLGSIRPADDAREHLSRRVPSLLVEGLTVAGA